MSNQNAQKSVVAWGWRSTTPKQASQAQHSRAQRAHSPIQARAAGAHPIYCSKGSSNCTTDMSSNPGALEQEVERLRAENAQLQAELDALRASQAGSLPQTTPPAAAATQEDPPAAAANGAACCPPAAPAASDWDGLQHGLDKDQIARYSRQIILHSFGVQGGFWTAGQKGWPSWQRWGHLVWPSFGLCRTGSVDTHIMP